MKWKLMSLLPSIFGPVLLVLIAIQLWPLIVACVGHPKTSMHLPSAIAQQNGPVLNVPI
jgi:hypothetical protein